MFVADPSLPICPHLQEIATTLEQHHQLVLEAPPGAGKTTSVPLALRDAPWRRGRKILLLEPRRVAARSAAERMAQLLGEAVGESVGYSMRLERKVSAKTVVEVITEGVLTRRLQRDPELADTALIIFDEFHERNIHSDLGLALSLQARELFRDESNPLRLLVMSATLDGAAVAALLKAPVISSQGRSFPVSVHYGQKQPLAAQLPTELPDCIHRALHDHDGNILVFLPGQREIRQCQAQLSQRVDASIALLPLHGSIPLAEQRRALAPLPADGTARRKIVLATDLAETSLTIEGVHIVIDAGLARRPRFDPRTGMTRLETVRVSRASSEQRAGRAGRLAPGNCYRLWSAEQQAQLQPHTTPEILQADLAPLALQLLQWGVQNPDELAWLDPPPAGAYRQALDLLRDLGAVGGSEAQPVLTAHGQAMAQLPCEPRLGHMLLVATHYRLLPLAAQLAALLGERDPLSVSDLQLALQTLTGQRPCARQHQAWRQRCRQQAQHYEQLITNGITEKQLLNEAVQTGFLLASAYPDRIARKRPNSRHQYLLSNGRAARLPESDPLAGTEWLAVAELSGTTGQREDTIYRAVELAPELFDSALQALVSVRKKIAWEDNKLIAEQHTCIGQIVLKRQPLTAVSAQQRQQALVDMLQKQGLSLLPWTPQLRQWQARVCLLHQTLPQHSPPWPDVSDQHLLQTLPQWLAPFLDQVSSRADLNQLPLKTILESLLPWPLPQQLQSLAPERLEVPSGSHLPVDYSQSPPVLEVKLQEMFGCKHTPSVANGAVALVVHLLSPARRPLQITQDLEGFWNNGYQAVKKEMKGRYPKHPWPDNPWDAQASRFTKKRQP